MKPQKPNPPEVIGPCAAIRRAFERDGETISVYELRAMTADERWELAREAVKELYGVELEARR